MVAGNAGTGAGIILAQRVEQMAHPGAICLTAAFHEALPGHLSFEYVNLGEHQVKGFSEPVRVYTASLKPGSAMPEPEARAIGSLRAAKILVIATGLIVVLGLGWVFFGPKGSQGNTTPINRMSADVLADRHLL